jgi:hypothetical protein
VVDTNAHAVAKAIHQFYEEKLETYMIAQVRELKKQYAWSGMTDAIRGLLK